MAADHLRENEMSEPTPDLLAFLRSMWSNAGIPLPGLMTPTLDASELDKRIGDMKAVEGWLKLNLGMLQMSIQGLEMQRATLGALHAAGQPATGADAPPNPFANPALWPWTLGQPDPGNAPAAAPKKKRGGAGQ
jgi:hypothetical protein